METAKAEIVQHADFMEFLAHAENGKLIVDQCEGITPEQALSVFPAWALAAATKGK